MKITMIVFVILSLFVGSAHAERKTVYYESIAVGAVTAKELSSSLDATVYDAYRAVRGVITVEDNNIRFRLDGTSPTTTEGLIAYVGDLITIDGITDCRNFQAISTTGTATLKSNITADVQ